MMSEEAFSRETPTSNKSPTPDSNPNSPTERPRVTNDQTVVCSSQEMAQFTAKLEKVKDWTVRKFKTQKQQIMENLGKAEKTVDTDMEQRVSNLNDLHNRYLEILSAATAYSNHFNALNGAQKMLAESFYQLSLREADLKEKLNDQNETLRQFNQLADEFSKQLTYFVSSMETLCNKTIKDTLLTIQVCENARLEYDSARHEIHLLQQNPESARNNIDSLQQKCDSLKQKYEQLKEDVRVKLALLDENRLKVMRSQLDQFEKGLHQYFTESIKALAQSPKTEDNDSNFVRGVRGSSSFLEQ